MGRPSPARERHRLSWSDHRLPRREDGNPELPGSVGQPLVVGDDAVEFVAELQRCREMKGVEATERRRVDQSPPSGRVEVECKSETRLDLGHRCEVE